MKGSYFKTFIKIERIHRIFLKIIKIELSRMKISDITNVQCVILYNVGQEKVAVGDLMDLGYYLGSNVFYNMNSMIKNGYLVKERRCDDNRVSDVNLSNKGIELHKKLDDLFVRHEKYITNKGIDLEKSDQLDNILISLEWIWKNLSIYDCLENESFNENRLD